MVSQQDTEQLARATELLLDVLARHRSEDLRAVSIFTDAIQDSGWALAISADIATATLP